MGGRVYHDIESPQQVSYVTTGFVLRISGICAASFTSTAYRPWTSGFRNLAHG